ncbi:MAG TPA: DUF2281 domain-containing protein [Armatimonadota bacterium]|mgnify:CR=1 FL=1|nr:DUF2281 domain-containing protein [Armatimonadota bacterium]
MTLVEALLERLRTLPPEKQREVLDSAEFLAQQSTPRRPKRSLEGLCADLDIHITEEDIAEARREMWGGFPRGDVA